jgi:tRNA (guanosine-2'-O-)-methyltransferase
MEAHTQPEDSEAARLLAALWAEPLAQEITERRLTRLVEVVRQRLASVTVVAENLVDNHNVSAIVRTAEGFGLDAIHVVEQPHRFERNKAIVRGADRWIQIKRHQGLARCLGDLNAAGFVTAAADVGPGTVPLHELPVEKPIALVMGSEHDGLSKRAKTMADLRFTIPMQGFTDSFNVSVSAAVALFDLTIRRREHLGVPGDLPYSVMEERVLDWLKKAAAKRHREKRMKALAKREARAKAAEPE